MRLADFREREEIAPAKRSNAARWTSGPFAPPPPPPPSQFCAPACVPWCRAFLDMGSSGTEVSDTGWGGGMTSEWCCFVLSVFRWPY